MIACLVRRLSLIMLVSATATQAQVPQLINHQGRVAVGNVNFNGTGAFKFALVDATGTTTYWSNDGSSAAGSEPTSAVTLAVTKGLYSVLLGDASLTNMSAISNSVFTNSDVRLRVWFNDGTNGSQHLTPDQRIAAVGYAMVASMLQPGAAISASTIDVNGSMHVGSYAPDATPKLIQFGDLGYVTIGENTEDNQMELKAGKFVFLNGTIFGDGSGLTGIPASAVTGTIRDGQVAKAPPGMVLIPAGAFTMGNSVAADTDITDAAPVSTTVSAVYMDVNEVTLSQWQSVYYWAKDNGYTDLPTGSGKGPNHPVQTVNWYDCVKWCNARSEQAGKTPVYYTNDAQTTIYKTGNVNVTNAQAKWTANGYRLPTEAEWEKAARGGMTGQRFPWGNTITQNLANYQGDTANYTYDLGPDGFNSVGSVGGTTPATSPVGIFAANGYGLYDMAGNVWEWCWDWYGMAYAGGTDPHGPPQSSSRVIRGGSWTVVASGARCAGRVNYDPANARDRVGFRVVLPIGQP